MNEQQTIHMINHTVLLDCLVGFFDGCDESNFKFLGQIKFIATDNQYFLSNMVLSPIHLHCAHNQCIFICTVSGNSSYV